MKKRTPSAGSAAGIRLFTVLCFLLSVIALAACSNPSGGGPTWYTVTYSAGRGTGTVPASQTVLAGTAITLPQKGDLAAIASTERFGGWSNGQRPYAADASYTVNAAVTFTAQWMEPLALANNALAAYLFSAPGGDPGGAGAADPVPLPVNIALANDWSDLLTAISNGGKYVALDLSACDMTGTTGEFDPDIDSSTGKSLVAALVLPDDATSIKAGTYYYDSTFRYFAALKTVSGANITTVGNYAFEDHTALKTVSLPKATDIGVEAFANCAALASVSLPQAADIGSNAFRGCTALKTVSFPEAADIGSNAFDGCAALETVSLPQAADIGNDAFRGCTALKTVSFPQALTVGDYAFSGCTALKTVPLPQATDIGGGAFYGCTALETVSLPEATDIGYGAFADCTALETVSLPKALAVGNDAFADCAALETVSLPEALTVGNNAFDRCTALETVPLPKAAAIGNYAFRGCTALETVSLPEATAIGYSAFMGTGITGLTVTLGTASPTVGVYMFYEVDSPKTVTVRVPYASAAEWEPAGYNATWVTAFTGGNTNINVDFASSL